MAHRQQARTARLPFPLLLLLASIGHRRLAVDAPLVFQRLLCRRPLAERSDDLTVAPLPVLRRRLPTADARPVLGEPAPLLVVVVELLRARPIAACLPEGFDFGRRGVGSGWRGRRCRRGRNNGRRNSRGRGDRFGGRNNNSIRIPTFGNPQSPFPFFFRSVGRRRGSVFVDVFVAVTVIVTVARARDSSGRLIFRRNDTACVDLLRIFRRRLIFRRRESISRRFCTVRRGRRGDRWCDRWCVVVQSGEAFGLVEDDVATEGKGHHGLRREVGGRLERSGIIDNGQHHGIALFDRKITQIVEPREVENEAFAGVHAPRAARSFVRKIRRGHRVRWVKKQK